MNNFQDFLDQALKNIEIIPNETEPQLYEYDVFEEIRSQIIRIRTDLGLTQKELAEKAGLTQANISKIEKGITHPTLDTLLKLANGLDMKLSVNLIPFEGGPDYD